MVKVKYSSYKAKIVITHSKRLLDRSIRRGFKLVDDIVQKDLQKGFREPKTGKFYKTKYGLHRASAPYEYPAILTGKLSKSIRSTQSRRRLEVGTSIDYAPYLEFGSAKILPRPFIDKTATRTERQTERAFVRALRGIV